MKPIKYETGQEYGLLTLVRFSKVSKWGTKFWICRCVCGNEREFAVYDVYHGHTKSCGCMSRKWATKNRKDYHGMTETKEYRAWCGMRSRCYLKTNKKYSYYGGRGIIVEKIWRNSFQNFLKDMGSCPEGMSLDRIDPNGNYESGNCRWASDMTQGSNKRNCKKVILNGVEITRVEAERLLSLGYGSIHNRKKLRGETLQQATDYFAKKKNFNINSFDIRLRKEVESNFLVGQMGMVA